MRVPRKALLLKNTHSIFNCYFSTSWFCPPSASPRPPSPRPGATSPPLPGQPAPGHVGEEGASSGGVSKTGQGRHNQTRHLTLKLWLLTGSGGCACHQPARECQAPGPGPHPCRQAGQTDFAPSTSRDTSMASGSALSGLLWIMAINSRSLAFKLYSIYLGCITLKIIFW